MPINLVSQLLSFGFSNRDLYDLNHPSSNYQIIKKLKRFKKRNSVKENLETNAALILLF